MGTTPFVWLLSYLVLISFLVTQTHTYLEAESSHAACIKHGLWCMMHRRNIGKNFLWTTCRFLHFVWARSMKGKIFYHFISRQKNFGSLCGRIMTSKVCHFDVLINGRYADLHSNISLEAGREDTDSLRKKYALVSIGFHFVDTDIVLSMLFFV